MKAYTSIQGCMQESYMKLFVRKAHTVVVMITDLQWQIFWYCNCGI